MHPAPSVIVFTTLSGMGFGLLAFLGLGLPMLAGWAAFLLWGLGYALAVIGLMASTFHLGHPERAIRAFSQWRSSWLSREAWTSVATLLLLAPVALSDWLGLGWTRIPGTIGAAMAVLTIFCTSMIYAQLRTIPRWHNWTTPFLFLSFMLAGGALLSANRMAAVIGCAIVAVSVMAHFRLGDGAFGRLAQSLGTATSLDRLGQVRVLEQPNSSPNYLMREMIHVVARKHVPVLRVIAVLCAALLPLVILFFPVAIPVFAILAVVHLLGAVAQRWLFFAEAEHVVGLYYGMR